MKTIFCESALVSGLIYFRKITMELFVIWVALSALLAWFSVKKERGFWGIFIISFVFSPLIGLVALLLLKANPEQDDVIG